MKGTNVCRMHGGSAPQVRQAAMIRLLMSSDSAVGLLIQQVSNRKLSASDRRAAAIAVLDRAGLKPTAEGILSELGMGSDRLSNTDLSMFTPEELQFLHKIALKRQAMLAQMRQLPEGQGEAVEVTNEST